MAIISGNKKKEKKVKTYCLTITNSFFLFRKIEVNELNSEHSPDTTDDEGFLLSLKESSNGKCIAI